MIRRRPPGIVVNTANPENGNQEAAISVDGELTSPSNDKERYSANDGETGMMMNSSSNTSPIGANGHGHGSRSSLYDTVDKRTTMNPKAFMSEETLNENSESESKPGKHVFNFIHYVYIAIVTFLLYFAVYNQYHSLPQAKTSEDTPLYQFSEERARLFLSDLIALGDSRLVGSDANEVHAPQLILKYVQDIQIKTGAKIETELQRSSGTFNIDFLGGFTSVYKDVQNVLVLLTLEKPVEDGILMISAHYDTAVGVRGAGDNGASVANMIEIMSALAHSIKHRGDNDPPRKSVLFIFSGAEETILQASHGYVTSEHKWLNHIQAFINLEAAGSGGRELMFQTTHSDLTKTYARCAPYPHSSVIAQEVFQSGVIQSDTDFRIYAKKLHGMDFAFVENGYVYHTILDDLPALTPGSIQHYGSNILGVAECLINSDLSVINGSGGDNDSSKTNVKDSQKPVFFNFFGRAIVFSFMSLHLLNLLTLGLLAGFIYFFCFKVDPITGLRLPIDLIWKSLTRILVTFFCGLFLAIASSLLMITTGSVLRYYANPWLSFGLYAFPSLIGFVIGNRWFNSKYEHSSTSFKADKYHLSLILQQELAGFIAASIFWTILLIPMWIKGFGSSFLPAFWILFPLIARVLYYIMFFPILRSGSRTKSIESQGGGFLQHLINATFTIFGCFIPSAISCWHFIIVLKFFIPITGRSGQNVPGDTIIAVIESLLIFVLGITPLSILLPRFNKSVVDFLGFLLLYLWIISVFLGALYFPHGYSPTQPKRVFLAHVHKDSHLNTNDAETNVIWMLGADYSRLEPIRNDPNIGPKMEKGSKWTCDAYPKHLYCDLPFFLPLVKEIPENWVIPATEKLPKHDDDEYCRIVVEKIEATGVPKSNRVHLRLDNPTNHVSIYVPGEAINLWSFSREDMTIVNGHFFVTLTIGLDEHLSSPHYFWIDTSNPKLELAWACHDFEATTPELESIVSSLPEWSTPIRFISYWRRKSFPISIEQEQSI